LLINYLSRANKFIRQTRNKFPEINYSHGIILPFCQDYIKNCPSNNSNMIVEIKENDFICFETKKRVPYRIVAETIEYLINKNDLKNLKNQD
jgi:phosphatidylinositol 4-kinase B